MTPTARTLAHLRSLGYLAEVVERRLPRAFITRDLFGLADVLALRPCEVLLVQCTSGANHAARVKKALASPHLAAVLLSGVRFEVWSWSKRGAAGQRKLWTLRRERIALEGAALVLTEVNP